MTNQFGHRHVAAYYRREDGLFNGGCDVCGHHWYGETDETRADAWCAGHNSAVNGINARPQPLWFPPVGPGQAIRLYRLADLLVDVAYEVGHDSEIVVPASQPPLLFVFTPPTEEGWHRERLGAVYIERDGDFIPEPDPADRVPDPRCDADGHAWVDGACQRCSTPR